MFDKLVESAKQKQGNRARRLFIVTGVIYAVALTGLGVMAIIGFSPALAEEHNVLTTLIPPVPSGPDPQTAPSQPKLKPAPAADFMPPKEIKDIPTLEDLKKLDLAVRSSGPIVAGAPIGIGIGNGGGFSGATNTNETTPPPPPPTPTPAVKPVAPPTPDQVVRLTSVLTQGRALRKAHPPYPTIARQVRAQGLVQVQISISETGEVTDAILLSGHPLLRDAALQAAKQWRFKPTELNGRPVRAIGVITFNFMLN